MKGRIIRVNRSNYNVMLDKEKVVRSSNRLIETPTVGDFVRVENGVIQEVLPRTSVLYRKGIIRKIKKQVIAANMDVIYICMSANKDFNLTKFKDYLALANTAGVEVRVLLTKIDLTNNVNKYILQLPIEVTPVSIERSISHLVEEIQGKTVVFIGASGVGKSSIITKLTNKEIETKSVRESDAQGRHTTTARTMYITDQFSVIDVPGIRIVKAVNRDFSEIEEAALGCKFSNCKHLTEPKCRVKELVKEGIITQEDLEEYQKK